jgi:hypothetical protein
MLKCRKRCKEEQRGKGAKAQRKTKRYRKKVQRGKGSKAKNR